MIEEKTPHEIVNEEKRRLLFSKKFIKYFIRFFYYDQILPRRVDQETALLAKYCYLLIRHVDDVADGDYQIFPNQYIQEQYIATLRYWLSTEESSEESDRNYKSSEPTILILYQAALDLFKERGLDNDEMQTLFKKAIDPIFFDYERALATSNHHILSHEQLREYFYNTFAPSIDIMLITMREKFRSVDVPFLSIGQGQLYSLADLEVDWKRGIINLPAQLLEEAKLNGSSTYHQVINNQVILRYLLNEIYLAKPQLQELKQQIQQLQHPETKRMCGHLVRTMESIISIQEPRLRLQLLKKGIRLTQEESFDENSL